MPLRLNQPRQIPNDLIEPKVAARIARVHITTIHRWIHAGKLKAWRRGFSRYLVSRAHVEAMLTPVEVVMEQRPRTAAEREIASEMALADLRAKGWQV